MNGTQLHQIIGSIGIKLDDFEKISKIKKRTIINHYHTYKFKEFPENLSDIYTRAIDIASKQLYGAQIESKRVLDKITGPTPALLKQMLDVLVKEMDEMRTAVITLEKEQKSLREENKELRRDVDLLKQKKLKIA